MHDEKVSSVLRHARRSTQKDIQRLWQGSLPTSPDSHCEASSSEPALSTVQSHVAQEECFVRSVVLDAHDLG